MKPALAAASALAIIVAAPAAHAAPVLPNGSFETPAVSGHVYNPSVAGVAFNAGSGVQRNGSDWGFANAPGGVQTAFIQSSTSYTGQITFALTDLVVGQAYSISFKAAARPSYATNAFTVALNGAALGSYNTAVTAWQSYTTNSFVATGTTASLSFIGSATTNGDNDVGLDDVAISAVPEPATWGLMLTGLGLVGGGLRSRRVRFARVAA